MDLAGGPLRGSRQLLELFPRTGSAVYERRLAVEVGHRIGRVRESHLDLDPGQLALSPNPAGFSATELACQVRNLGGPAASNYGRHHASYDLKKFRGEQGVQRLPRKQRYQPLPQGLKVLAALLVLRDKVIQPLLAAALQTRPTHGAQNPTRLDHH